MKSVLKVFSLVLVALLSACTTTDHNDARQNSATLEQEIYLDGDTLFYKGSMTTNKTAEAMRLLDEYKPSKLFISSPGGDVESSIRLAQHIHANKIDVHLGRLCASSCANYILPAAENVYFAKDSILIWHGGSYQPDANKMFKANHEFLQSWRAMENEFFLAVGVSPFITVCGMEQVSFFDNLLHLLQIKKIIGFTYSLEDIKKFGVTNIHLAEGE